MTSKIVMNYIVARRIFWSAAAVFIFFIASPLAVNAVCSDLDDVDIPDQCTSPTCTAADINGSSCAGGRGTCQLNADGDPMCTANATGDVIMAAWGAACTGGHENDRCSPTGNEPFGTCESVGGDVTTFLCNRPAETAGTTARTIEPRNLPNPLGNNVSIFEVIARVITIMTSIAGSIALLMFVYGGVLWMTSGGSSEKIEAGKKAVVWATIGLFVIFGSYAILRVIFTALGARL